MKLTTRFVSNNGFHRSIFYFVTTTPYALQQQLLTQNDMLLCSCFLKTITIYYLRGEKYINRPWLTMDGKQF